jgi:hypothetical protein
MVTHHFLGSWKPRAGALAHHDRHQYARVDGRIEACRSGSRQMASDQDHHRHRSGAAAGRADSAWQPLLVEALSSQDGDCSGPEPPLRAPPSRACPRTCAAAGHANPSFSTNAIRNPTKSQKRAKKEPNRKMASPARLELATLGLGNSLSSRHRAARAVVTARRPTDRKPASREEFARSVSTAAEMASLGHRGPRGKSDGAVTPSVTPRRGRFQVINLSSLYC